MEAELKEKDPKLGPSHSQAGKHISHALSMLRGLDNKSQCKQTRGAIANLQSAISWLDERKADREKRGVEGTSQT